MALEFPFVELNDAQKIFCQIPNYDELVKQCPEKGAGRDWEEAVFALFEHMGGGWTSERQEIAARLFKTKDTQEARAQLAYLMAWLGNFTPSHQEKLRVAA